MHFCTILTFLLLGLSEFVEGDCFCVFFTFLFLSFYLKFAVVICVPQVVFVLAVKFQPRPAADFSPRLQSQLFQVREKKTNHPDTFSFNNCRWILFEPKFLNK